MLLSGQGKRARLKELNLLFMEGMAQLEAGIHIIMIRTLRAMSPAGSSRCLDQNASLQEHPIREERIY